MILVHVHAIRLFIIRTNTYKPNTVIIKKHKNISDKIIYRCCFRSIVHIYRLNLAKLQDGFSWYTSSGTELVAIDSALYDR